MKNIENVLFGAERDVEFFDSERVADWNKSLHFHSQTCDEPSLAEPLRRLLRHPRNALLIIQWGTGKVIIAEIKGKCNREMEKRKNEGEMSKEGQKCA